MTQVKICGLTRAEDVELACALGASYVGINFAAKSPRRVTPGQSRDLSRAVRPGALRVGVFVDETYDQISEAVEAAGLDLAQIHRELREEDLERVLVPVVAVARVRGAAAPIPGPALLGRCRAILFDTAAAGRNGGAGIRFDWRLLDGKTFPVPLFLAGGLDPDNVSEAIARVRPAAVDVASGIESSPGIKDRRKMERFFEEVARADGRASQAS
jgi:phosphoribosylanthranilate isomerase